MAIASSAYEQIRAMILSGDLASGDRVPETQTADVVGVSRPTVRSALAQLTERGLLEDDGRGLRVARMDGHELRDALRTRAVLDGLSAREAAEKVRDGQVAPARLAELSSLASVAEDATTCRDLLHAAIANRAFHDAIGRIADNRSCTAALGRLWDRVLAATISSLQPADRAQRVAEEHRDLVAAIAGGTPDSAAAIAHDHVLATLEALA